MVTDSTDSFLLGLNIFDVPINALLDSGATHCFIDSTLISDHRLPMTLLPQPMRLCLFDGSYAPEKNLYEVTVPIYFTPAKVLPVSILVTPLDPNVSAVIGLRWLRQHNLLVDWANNRIEYLLNTTTTWTSSANPRPTNFLTITCNSITISVRTRLHLISFNFHITFDFYLTLLLANPVPTYSILLLYHNILTTHVQLSTRLSPSI